MDRLLDPGVGNCTGLLEARVFASDVLLCDQCGGRAEVIAAITQPKIILAILKSLGLSARAPPIAPARPTPQAELAF